MRELKEPELSGEHTGEKLGVTKWMAQELKLRNPLWQFGSVGKCRGNVMRLNSN